MEVNRMNKEQITEFNAVLLEFVKRAAAKGATVEEVEALPAVAQVLKEINFI